MGHRSSESLERLIKDAQSQIKVDQIYQHYKDSNKTYRIVAVALDEASENVSIVYQALYSPYLTWIRPITNFLEDVSWEGKVVSRFQLATTP